jgi:hypothetical protein
LGDGVGGHLVDVREALTDTEGVALADTEGVERTDDEVEGG